MNSGGLIMYVQEVVTAQQSSTAGEEAVLVLVLVLVLVSVP